MESKNLKIVLVIVAAIAIYFWYKWQQAQKVVTLVNPAPKNTGVVNPVSNPTGTGSLPSGGIPPINGTTNSQSFNNYMNRQQLIGGYGGVGVARLGTDNGVSL